jgi:hypothetical protein
MLVRVSLTGLMFLFPLAVWAAIGWDHRHY